MMYVIYRFMLLLVHCRGWRERRDVVRLAQLVMRLSRDDLRRLINNLQA